MQALPEERDKRDRTMPFMFFPELNGSGSDRNGFARRTSCKVEDKKAQIKKPPMKAVFFVVGTGLEPATFGL
jgi:hypothetical protein